MHPRRHVAAFVLLAGRLVAQDAAALLPADIATAAAPPPRELQIGPLLDLGSWDMAYAVGDADLLVVRRGAQLLRWPTIAGARPAPWFSAAELQQARIVGHVTIGNALWLVVEARDRAPFVLEPTLGKRLDLQVPGLDPDSAPRIQSLVALPRSGVALLMLESGDAANWPRAENRPIWFRVDFNKQKVAALPTGWDLGSFSADQKVAVFDDHAPGTADRPKTRALDLATGEELQQVADNDSAPRAEFHWPDRSAVVPLTAAQDDGRRHVTGVCAAGTVVPLQVEILSPFHATAKAIDGWVALHAQGRGEPRVDDGALWFGALRAAARPTLLARQVTGYEVLGNGRCAFVVGEPGNKPMLSTAQAFVYDTGLGKVWNLLDGVARLPPLPAKLRDTAGVNDNTLIELLASSGQEGHNRLALAWFRHERGDMRSRTPEMKELLPRRSWQRLVLVNKSGERGVAEAPVLPRVTTGLQQELQACWLFASGRLILRQGGDMAGAAGIQLSAVDLRLPQ